MKKLLVPLLIVLKLFKLKLLLFLPLILGLASFKKFLGFMALVVPGLIGFFKLCKPDLQHNYGTFGHSSFYHRPTTHGSGASGPVYTPYREQQQESLPPYREHPDANQYLYESQDARPSYGQPYNSRPARNQQDNEPIPVAPAAAPANAFRPSGSVAFKEDANEMAYGGYKRQQK